MIGFAPAPTTTFSRVNGSRQPAEARGVVGDRVAQLGNPGRRRVVRVVVEDRLHAGGLDVLRRVEVGLADLHVDDAPARRLDRLCAGEHGKGALGADARHGFAEVVGVVGDGRHGKPASEVGELESPNEAELMRTLTEVFAPGAPSLPEGLRTLVVSPDRSVEPGTTVRATFAFYNFGGAAATGLRVRFNLPDGLRYVPGSARVDDRPLDDVRGETSLLAPNGADVGEVPPGIERRIAIAYVVAPTIENGAPIELQAALASNETDVIGSNVIRLAASSAPDLDNPETFASLEAMRDAEPGEEVHVAARVHNSGHATAHDVVVVLPVPDRTTYVAGSARIDGRESSAVDERGGDPFGFGTATIASPSLAAGATLVVEYRARIESPLDDNTRLVLRGAVASAETAEFELARAELIVRSASRFDTEATRLEVDAPTEVEPGRRVRVAIAAENAGTCAAEDARVRITLPDGLRYAPGSRAVDGRSASETDAPGAFIFPRIDAGARVEAAVDAYVVSPAVDGTPLPITGSLQWATGSRAFERTLIVRSSPRFLEARNVLVLDGPAHVTPGSEVRATIRIANDGTAQATGVRVMTDVDATLQSLRYVDEGGEARVQPAGIVLGTLPPGATRTLTIIGTVASPIADHAEIRLRARLENDQTSPIPLGTIELAVRSRPRFAPVTSTLAYPAGEPLRPSRHGDVVVALVNDGTDVARDTRLQLEITPDARLEAVDGATRVGTTLLFGDVPPGTRAEATVRLRLARLVARGTAITVNARLEAVGLLPLALAPVTIPTFAEPRFDEGASLRMQPPDTADAGEPLFVRLTVRNTGDGAASRFTIRGQLPPHTAYYPGSTAVNDVPLLDVDGGSVLWSKSGLVLEDVDPGVEVVIRYGTIVNTPLAAGTLIDAQIDLAWDGGALLTVASPAVRVRSTPAFAVRASGLPFSVSGIAPRTSDVLQDIAEQRRAAQPQLPTPPMAALPAPPPVAEPPAPPERATFRYDEDTIDARFTLTPEPAVEAPPPTPPAPAPPPHAAAAPPEAEPVAPPPAREPEAAQPQPAEPAMPDADVAAGPVAAVPETPERVDDVAAAQAPAAPASPPAPAPPVEPVHAPAAEAAPVPPPEPERPRAPALAGKRVRVVFPHDALERALAFLEQSDYGGLITHLFAIRTLLPTSFVGLDGDVPGKLLTEREALRGVVDRLFIKMRMPRYALTAKDLEDRSSRAALVELIGALRDAAPSDEMPPGEATVVLEGTVDLSRLAPHVAALESDPLGSARPWLVLAEILPSTFVTPRGSEAMNAYRSALVATFTNVVALPNEEFHRVLAGTQNNALDAALRDLRLALRDALEAAAAKA